jgi:C-1 hydroxylase
VSELAAEWAAAWNAHDVDAVTEWYATDGVHRMASGNTYTGADDVRAMVERTLAAYPDLHFDVRRTFATAQDFVIEYTMRGHQQAAIGDRPGTGRAIEVDGVLVGTTDGDGRVTACVDYLDHLTIRRQLGLDD